MKQCFVLAAVAAAAAGASAQQFVQETATRFPSPGPNEYTNQVSIADIDGDGDLDIVWANGGGYNSAQPPMVLRLYINDGSGVFTDESAARTGGATAIARDVEFADVDGDGDLDMALSTDFSTQPRLFINDGAGFFSDETAARLPAMAMGSPHCTFLDIENDGDLDLAFANGGASRWGTSTAQLFLNDGSGVYSNVTATHLPAVTSSQPMDIIAGDLDGDFDLDLLVGARTNSSRLFLNDGSGVFIDATAGGWPGDGTTYSFDFGDIDGDGDLDVFGANSLLGGGSRDAIFVNDGAGAFTNASATWLPGANNPAIDDNDSKFFDVDDDGDLDLIVGSLGSSERIYLNNGSSFTLTAGMISPVSDSTLDVEVADLDADGDFDVVTAQGESGAFTNRVYINSGPADTRAPRIVSVEQVASPAMDAEPQVVRAVIRDDMTSDSGFHARSLQLAFEIEGGAGPVMTAPLRRSGHDVYRGVIPGMPSGVTVLYHVVAEDFAGNIAVGATQQYTVGTLGDLNGDGVVGGADLAILLGQWGQAGSPADLNGDDTVDGADLAILLGAWTT